MSIDPLSDGAALQQSHQGERATNVREPAPEQEKASAAAGYQVLISGSVSRTFDDLQAHKERQGEVAGAIRETDSSLRLLGQKIDAMKAPLQAIVKNFPPFSQQDKARMQLLMSYTAIRKEIEHLTFPPPPDAVQPQGPPAVPAALPAGADDSQINDHLAKLDAASASLARLREALAADSLSFFRVQHRLPSAAASAAAPTALPGGSMTEQQAREKSAEVGRQFATSVEQGVAQQNSQFLKVLSL